MAVGGFIMTKPSLYKTVTIDRIYEKSYGRVASLRNYWVEDAIARGVGLRVNVKHRDAFMLIPFGELGDCYKNTWIIKSSWVRGKHNKYTLWDYVWRDDSKPVQEEFFSVGRVNALHNRR